MAWNLEVKSTTGADFYLPFATRQEAEAALAAVEGAIGRSDIRTITIAGQLVIRVEHLMSGQIWESD